MPSALTFERNFSCLVLVRRIAILFVLFALLSCDQFVIETSIVHQFVVSSIFHDFSSLQSDDQIRITNGTQSMSNDDGRSPFFGFVQCILNNAFTGVVYPSMSSWPLKKNEFERTYLERLSLRLVIRSSDSKSVHEQLPLRIDNGNLRRMIRRNSIYLVASVHHSAYHPTMFCSSIHSESESSSSI